MWPDWFIVGDGHGHRAATRWPPRAVLEHPQAPADLAQAFADVYSRVLPGARLNPWSAGLQAYDGFLLSPGADPAERTSILFVAGSLAWSMIVDKFRPGRYDFLGAVICLIGVAVIMYGPRS